MPGAATAATSDLRRSLSELRARLARSVAAADELVGLSISFRSQARSGTWPPQLRA